ncbi:unnamed protein product [Psylliodes chrysocephalus]|uniref:Uncharacterized protein n=1 Tax=Psylliodes chrysocephalus TaxID=3402493 RepID=A0A9P0CUV6_9CUCU|nr:unnamed protein product [Psylliodes chrysocephala]
MFPAKLLLFYLQSITFISAATFDFSVVYRLPHDVRGHQFPAGREISETLGNATEIAVDQKVPIVLRSFDVSFAKNLRVLVMNNCGINEIEVGSFKNLPETVEHLNITGNPLKAIRDGIFNYLTIEVLNLSSNKLATISSGAFDSMPNLTRIILDYNELTSYAIWFQDCPNLVSISAQYNFIQYIPPNIFEKLSSHKLKVHFSYNKINIIHQDLFNVEEFAELYLDHNDMTEFDLDVSKISGTFSLEHNHIECLSDEFIRNDLKKVQKLDLRENPINCTCYEGLVKIKNLAVSPTNCTSKV